MNIAVVLAFLFCMVSTLLGYYSIPTSNSRPKEIKSRKMISELHEPVNTSSAHKYTHDADYPETNCYYKITVENGIRIICFNDKCEIRTNRIKINNTTNCYKLSNSFNTFKCCGEILSIAEYNHHEDNHGCYAYFSHSWCTFMLSVYKMIMIAITWLVVYIIKIPLLYLMRLLDILSNRFINQNKQCRECESKYKFIHLDCKQPAHTRTDYNILYYITLVILLVLVPVVSGDSKFNTYHHDEYTEFIISDRERVTNEFYNNQNHILITIESSYIIYKISHLHKVVEKTADVVESSSYSCDNEEDCKNHLRGDMSTYRYIKKNHDGLTCLTSDAIVCMTCSIKTKDFADVYEVIESQPVINLNIVVNNREPYRITVNSTDDYISSDFYIRYLNPVNPKYNHVLLKDKHVYSGNICTAPGFCYGSHIVINGTLSAIYEPIIRDNNRYDVSFILDQCTIKENLDINQLTLVGTYDKIDDGFSENFEFGHFSVGITQNMMLDDKKCEKHVVASAISASGCHSCKYGFDLTVRYKYITGKCGRLICKTPIYERKTYVENNGIASKDNTVTIRLYSDTDEVEVSCNGYSQTVILDDYRVDNHYVSTGYEVMSSVTFQDKAKNLINLISFDTFKIIFAIALICLLLYLTFRTILAINRHTKIARTRYYHKKDDDYMLSEIEEQYNIFK